MTLAVDVVSDVVCPWCFIGKRHLDQALRAWREQRPDTAVAVRWHPFFLDANLTEAGEPYRPYLERKFGGPQQLAEAWQRVGAAGRAAGIEFAFEKIEVRASTLHAHRLIHHAQESVGADATAALVEALFAAQFLEGRPIGDRAVLTAVAAECGMDRDVVRRYLDSAQDADHVRATAAQMERMGIGGVPLFVFDQRIAATGAQPPEVLLQAMREAAQAA